MKQRIIKVMALVLVIMAACQAWGGEWTENGFIYKPSLGARGASEKGVYDSSLDRMDARLGKEIWIGDPNYGSTIQSAVMAIGSNNTILRIPAGTFNITENLNIPANITVKPERGAIFAPADGATLTINKFDAGLFQVFRCTGTGNVVFVAGAVKEVYPQWWGAAGDGVSDDTAAINAASKAAVAAHLNLVLTPSNSYYRTTGTIFWGNDDVTGKGSTLIAWGAKIVQASGTGPVLLVTKYDQITGAFLTGNVNVRNAYANILGGWYKQSTMGESVIVLRATNKGKFYFENITGAGSSGAGSYGLRVEGTYNDGIAYAYGGGYYDNIGFGQIGQVYTGLSVKGASNSNTFYGGSIQGVTRGIEVKNDATVARPDVLGFYGIAVETVAANGTGVYCDSQGLGILFVGLRLEIPEATAKAIDTAYSGTSCAFVGCMQSGASTLAIGGRNTVTGCAFSTGAFDNPYPYFAFRTKADRFYSLGDSSTNADIPAGFYFKDATGQVDDALRIVDNSGNIKLQVRAGNNTWTTNDGLTILNRATVKNPRVQWGVNSLAYAVSITPNIRKGAYISIAQLTGNVTINLPANLGAGEQFFIEVQADATPRTITWGTGMNAAFTAVAANTLYVVEFVYNGSKAYQIGTPIGVTP